MFRCSHTLYFIAVMILANFPTEAKSGLRYGKYPTYVNEGNTNNSDIKTENKPRISRGFTLSAWSIVIIVVSVILLGVAVYYIALFYPIFCKKERKYDRIELAAV